MFPAVAKGDQTLTGFQYSASSVAFGSTVPTVTAPAGALTDLSYSADPASVCSVGSSTGALTIVEVGSCAVTATAASNSNYNDATATFTVTVQATRALVLNLDAIATDNVISIAEKASGFTISGDTGSEGGVSVSVEIGSSTLTAASADDSGTATWSVSVPANATYITGTSIDIAVSASKTGFIAPSAVQRTLTIDLAPPAAPTYTAPSSLQVGVSITAMTPSGGSGIAEYGATDLPSGLTMNTTTGVISGTPDTADADTASATVTVRDTVGNTDTVSIVFPAVAKGDQTLMGFQYSASSVTLGSTAPTVTAPTGVQTTLSYSAAPSTVCTVNSSTGALTLVGAGSCEITATAASSANYNEATVTVTVQATGVLVKLSVNPAAVDEDGSGASVTIEATLSGVARAEPTTLTVSVGASDDAAIAGADYVAVDNLSVTIPSGQTSGTATFTFTPLEDFIDERVEAVSITGTSQVADIAVAGTTLSINDNDERGVRITPTAITAPEGGNATYMVELTSEPTGDVTVTPSLGSGDTDVTVSAALTFNATTWNVAQTVTVSAAQDSDAANDTAAIAHAVAGADYGASSVTADDVLVTVDDDETAVTLTVNPTAVDEDAAVASV